MHVYACLKVVALLFFWQFSQTQYEIISPIISDTTPSISDHLKYSLKMTKGQVA